MKIYQLNDTYNGCMNEPGVHVPHNRILNLNHDMKIGGYCNSVIWSPHDSDHLKDYLHKRSDYSGQATLIDHNIKAANGNALRMGNEEGVVASYTASGKIDYNWIKNLFRSMKVNPGEYIKSDKDEYADSVINRVFGQYDLHKHRLYNKCCEYTPVIKPLYIREKRLYKPSKLALDMFKTIIIPDMLHRMESTLAAVIPKLTGDRWITENPQKQWTSSFNLTLCSPEDFYNGYYTPFSIGVPSEIETVLRLGLQCPSSPLCIINKDVLNIILNYLFVEYKPRVGKPSKSKSERFAERLLEFMKEEEW
jgi:hypothetical protein